MTYLRQTEPDELKQIGRNYFTKTHNSLCISPSGIWHWQSRHVGGKTALQYLIVVRGMSFYDAACHLMDSNIVHVPTPTQAPQQHEKALILPRANSNNDIAIGYLKRRGIHPAILEYCVANHSLYESLETDAYGHEHHNAVLVGYDTLGIPRYAFIRGTQEKRFARDADGSDKRYSFCIPATGSGKILQKTEAAIDVLSLATLAYEQDPVSWLEKHYLSGGGAANLPLEQYLLVHPDIETIEFCNDNDQRGRDMTARQMQTYVEKGYHVIDNPPPTMSCGKDYNDYIRIKKRRNRSIPASPLSR